MGAYSADVQTIEAKFVEGEGWSDLNDFAQVHTIEECDSVKQVFDRVKAWLRRYSRVIDEFVNKMEFEYFEYNRWEGQCSIVRPNHKTDSILMVSVYITKTVPYIPEQEEQI